MRLIAASAICLYVLSALVQSVDVEDTDDVDATLPSPTSTRVAYMSRRRRRRTYTPSMCHNFNGCQICLGPCQDGQAVSANCHDQCAAFQGKVSGKCQSEQVQDWSGGCALPPAPSPPGPSWQVQLTTSMRTYVTTEAKKGLPGLCTKQGQAWTGCECWTAQGAPQGNAPQCNSPPGCTVFSARPTGDFKAVQLPDNSGLDAQLAAWKLPDNVNKQFQIAKVAESENFTSFKVSFPGTGTGVLTEYAGTARTVGDAFELGFVMASTHATLAEPRRSISGVAETVFVEGWRRRRRSCHTEAEPFKPAQVTQITNLMHSLALQEALLKIPHGEMNGDALHMPTTLNLSAPVAGEAPSTVV